MLFYKVGIVLFCWVIEICLVYAIVWATRIKKDVRAKPIHLRYTKLAMILMGISILIIEGFVRLNGGMHSTYLAMVHIPLAGLSLVTGLTNLKVDGERHARLHGVLGYTCVTSYSIALILGMILLKQV